MLPSAASNQFSGAAVCQNKALFKAKKLKGEIVKNKIFKFNFRLINKF
jgi:hypothetical protein